MAMKAWGTHRLCVDLMSGFTVKNNFSYGRKQIVITKVYFMLWGLLFLAAAVIFAIGIMTPMTLVVFGFISFGMVFMGMMGVLPILVTHPEPTKAIKIRKERPVKEPAGKLSGAMAGFFETKGIPVRRPKYP